MPSNPSKKNPPQLNLTRLLQNQDTDFVFNENDSQFIKWNLIQVLWIGPKKYLRNKHHGQESILLATGFRQEIH